MSTDWTERELLVNLCVTAEEQRRLLEHLNNAERTGAVSSVAFEDMSKGDPKVSSKHYVGSPLTKEDVDAAWEIHAYAHRKAAASALDGWRTTVDALQAAQAAD